MSTISASGRSTPQQGAHPLAPQLDRARGVGPVAHIGGRSRQGDLGLQLAQQAHEVRRRRQGQVRVEALLEARRGVGSQPQAGRGPSHGGGVEGGGLQQQVARVALDLGARAPHHASQGHRGLPGADQQVGDLQPALEPVQRGQALALARQAHDDPLGGEPLAVEQVVGLAQVQHHEVREVDQQVDRTLPHGQQQMPQPLRAGLGARAVDRQRHVATAGGRVDAHRDRGAVRGRRQGQVERSQRTPVQGRDLRRDAAVPPQVRSVRDRLVVDLDRPVLEADGRSHGPPDLDVVGELPDAGVLLAQAQLALRADHALGLHPTDPGALDPEIARKGRADRRDGHLQLGPDVRGAANDLERLSTAHVDRAQGELVGVGVALTGQHLSDDDVGQAGREGLDPLDLGHREGQVVGHALGRAPLEVDVSAQPAPGELHANCSRKRRSPPSRSRTSSMP
jgi:hypothetical protein